MKIPLDYYISPFTKKITTIKIIISQNYRKITTITVGIIKKLLMIILHNFVKLLCLSW